MNGIEDELIIRIRKGDKKAFRILYEEYHEDLYFIAKRYLKDQNAVEDAVQDIFIKLWKKREDLDASSSIQGLLFTMLKNHILNMIRNRNTRKRILKEYGKLIARDRKRNMVEDEMLYREYQEILNQALKNLSPAQKKVFKMKVNQGFTNSKIAKIRNVSIRTVKTQFYLSSKFVRTYLSKYADI